jgi:hypothetical protein
MVRLRDHVWYAVTDDDLKLNEKMATVVGHFLCAAVKGNKVLQTTFRCSLRSGSWRVVKAYRLAKFIHR